MLTKNFMFYFLCFILNSKMDPRENRASFERRTSKCGPNPMSSVTQSSVAFINWENGLYKTYNHQEQIIILNWIARFRNEETGVRYCNEPSLLEQDQDSDPSGRLEREARNAWVQWAPNEVIFQEFFDSMSPDVQKKLRKKSRFVFK